MLPGIERRREGSQGRSFAARSRQGVLVDVLARNGRGAVKFCNIVGPWGV